MHTWHRGFIARTWLSISVELLAGGGQHLWLYPGRIFAVGSAHTLTDGSLATDEYTGQELTGSAFAGIVGAYDIEKTKVARTVNRGEEFKFTFDLGDDWVTGASRTTAKWTRSTVRRATSTLRASRPLKQHRMENPREAFSI